jgi:acyl-coenzyme A synthetase/AMP-(fatty) acid ligase
MIIDSIFEWAWTQPRKVALIHNNVSIEYATFAKTIETSQKFLEPLGLPPETNAVVVVKNLADAWPLILALRAMGLTTIRAESVTQLQRLGINNVSCIVTTVREQSLHGLSGPPMVGAKIIVVPEQGINATPPRELSAPLPTNRPCGGHILYTSGTTGDFKKLIRDSNREDARVSARSRAHSFNKDTVAYNWKFGQQTSIGWKVTLSVWRAGGCAVFDQRAEWHERIFDHPITAAFMNPFPLRKIIDTNNHNTNRCEILITSGLVGYENIAKAIAKFGDRLRNYYGSTELITPPLMSQIRSLDDALWLNPTADRTVQIVDDNDRECSVGQEGDLRILTTELDWYYYLDDEEATSKVFRNGFFYPGDRAISREDGRIRILGRASDVLNVQGYKIAVGPLEQAIQQHLGVDEVCVFSGLNTVGEDELVIAIRCENEPLKDNLTPIAREFTKFEKVKFYFLREFPRSDTGTGKVRRAELRTFLLSSFGVPNYELNVRDLLAVEQSKTRI